MYECSGVGAGRLPPDGRMDFELSRAECTSSGGEWGNANFNFDNVPEALCVHTQPLVSKPPV